MQSSLAVFDIAKISTNQGLALVVLSCNGTANLGNATPYLLPLNTDANIPDNTAIVGAKSDNKARVFLPKNGDLRSFTNVVAVTYVTPAMIKDKHALIPGVSGFEKPDEIAANASKMKITDIKLEKISSVNLVKYSTTFESEKKEEMNRKNDDHNPTHE